MRELALTEDRSKLIRPIREVILVSTALKVRNRSRSMSSSPFGGGKPSDVGGQLVSDFLNRSKDTSSSTIGEGGFMVMYSWKNQLTTTI
jgi:hypothetical protein